MPGLLRGVARTAVVAGTASAVAGNVNRRQQRRWASQDAEEQAAYAQQQAPSQPSAAGDTDGQIEQLEKLGTLRDKGILTQTEFEQKKREILGL